jgi:putative photosynthetic complex assembly protein
MSTTVIPTQTSIIPKPLLIVVGAALLLIFSVAAGVRLLGLNISAPDAPTVVTRELKFEDRADGSVAVIDSKSGVLVETIRGEAGFLRSTLRGLARERIRAGFGAEKPFELIGRADGRLTLRDPVTQRRVDLESFGPTNAANFARLLGNAQNVTQSLN